MRLKCDDENNKMEIKNIPRFLLSSTRRARLLAGTPAMRTHYLKKWKLIFLFIIMPALVGFYCYVVFHRLTADGVTPVVVEAGQIKQIKLHDTMFSNISTVETSVGIYQVRGAVSAEVGDTAKLNQEIAGSFKKASLCIDSKIKFKCYDVL
ncbi:hypothetical protein [Aeromonas caviae]|uniref:hypothetical protein n=1 Tax=Aeromonas caviae TaxID=648 RepID=UPI0029DE2892|nr:hypothetical protein [Aeromonas caviae]MDX7787747.1 hypothetical protein [Aeromonas caviae]